MNIHEHTAPACPCVMTQRDNCGSRLLQPLVSVTKIGTQVSCHSKSLFFRSLSIKGSGPHAGKPRAAESRPRRGRRRCFRGEEAEAGSSPGRIKINVYTGGGGGKICRRFGGRGGWWNCEGRGFAARPDSRSGSAEGGREGRGSCPRRSD